MLLLLLSYVIAGYNMRAVKGAMIVSTVLCATLWNTVMACATSVTTETNVMRK